MKKIWWTSGSGRIEFQLPEDCINVCYHPGDCDDDVSRCIELPDVKAELSRIDPEQLRKELYEYGAWTDEQLNDHQENLKRILWIASGDIYENNFH